MIITVMTLVAFKNSRIFSIEFEMKDLGHLTISWAARGHRVWQRLFLPYRCGAADDRVVHTAQHENIRKLLKAIDEQFVTSNKALASTLIMKFTSLKLTGIKDEPFKISYNTHKDKWSINELMTMCVQEEGRLMMEQGESAILVKQKKGKKRKSQAVKGSNKFLPNLTLRKRKIFLL
ncbi:hypothetical protein AAG906_010690 [Vitis piasezkii]